jgi:nucleoside-diphosphate-sugar epimerase
MTNSPTLLILGGSGFVSGTLARRAVDAGFAVSIVTRGKRPLPHNVTSIVVDRREREAFAQQMAMLNREWDLVVDTIGYEPEDARQDIACFRMRARQLIFISSDFVFDPSRRRFPQPEEGEFLQDGSYGAKKRLCELEFEQADCGSLAWTVVRPCHIYGPGSQLGCLPMHGRDPNLIAKLRSGQPLELVGGGYFLQQPIFAQDLADLILSIYEKSACRNQIYNSVGPEIVESRTYYQIIADILQAQLRITEVPVDSYYAAHPEAASFLCHRIYDMQKLRSSGALVPSTPLAQGLAEQVAGLLAAAQ